ncbi:MAG: hypothetical protein HOC71_02585 [Candidatus Latescibacteria bacterium]|jgi:hypothetical protein|nr:hypothetical protein [Candidatus Latescibacterota bacterium]
MIPQAKSDARRLYELLQEVRAANRRNKKYSLPLINIWALVKRIANYLTRRHEADENIDRYEKELGRHLNLAESSSLEQGLAREFRSLINDLSFCSAGFAGGSGQFYSIAGENDIIMDDITGWLPKEYHNLAPKMSRLSKTERYRLINGLKDKGTIDSRQHAELVRLFIDDIPDESTCDLGMKGEPVLNETIHPAFCPYRHEMSDGTSVCEFNSEDEDIEDSDDVDSEEDFTADDCNESPSEGSDSDSESDDDDEDDYEYTLDGESLDVSDASDIDVEFGDNSAEFDFDVGDFDGGDYDGGDN